MPKGESVTDWYRDAWIVIVLNAAITTVHAAAHIELAILPPPPDAVFILVIISLPILSMAMVRRITRFAWVLMLSFAASFVYGALSHFVLAGPDNALGLSQGPWSGVFQVTSGLLAVLEMAGVAVGIALIARARTPSGSVAPPA